MSIVHDIDEYIAAMKRRGLHYLTADELAESKSGLLVMYDCGKLREVRFMDSEGNVVQPGLYAAVGNHEKVELDNQGYVIIEL